MLAASLVLARLVFEPSSPTPKLTEDAVLLIQRPFANLGCAPDDPPPDAGTDAGDAGPADAGIPDAPDAGCEPIYGDAVSMVMRPRFATNAIGAKFAVLFVTPSRPIVETVPDPFPELSALTAPKTEIHITKIPDPALGEACDQQGCGFAASEPEPVFDPPDVGDAGLGDGAVAVETVGPYEIVRVQPVDTAELETLLGSFNYRVQPEDLAALGPYVAAGYTVVAVRVAVDQVGEALSPISLTWAGTELKLPVAVGTPSSAGLVAYVAASGRYEFPGAGVSFARYVVGGETSFLTRNDLYTLASDSPEDDPVAIAIAGSPEFSITHVVEQEMRVPVSNCYDIGCCDSGSPRPDFGVVAGVVVLALRRRKMR